MNRPELDELPLRNDDVEALVAGLGDHALYQLDPAGRIITWNEAARTLEGYAEPEILGQPLSRLYGPEELASGLPERLLETARNQGRAEHEGWRIRKDGSRMWARVVLQRLGNHAEKPRGYLHLTQDVGELYRTRRLLVDGERQAQMLVHAVKDYAIFMLDREGRIATWNLGAEQIKGYKESEIVGRHMSIFYTPEQKLRGRPAELLRRATLDGRVEDEGWRVRKDGSRFWANVVITRLDDGEGRLAGFAKVTRDLTERKTAEDAAREREELLRLMIDSIHDHAILMLDAEGRVASWNLAAIQVTGYSSDEIMGRPYRDFYLAEEARAGRAEAALRTAAEAGHAEEQAFRVRKSGERFWADVMLSAVRNAGSEIVGFTAVIRDLSERRHLERALWEHRIAANEAHTALRGYDEFISAAAHELRTPLTALQLRLQGLEQALRGTEPRPEESESLALRLECAVKQTERLSELVDRLIDVSRIANGKLDLHLERLDLVELARHVIRTHATLANARGSELVFSAGPPVYGHWDRDRLEQVLSQLLTNAVKYGRGKAVDVRVDGLEETALLVVSDRGIGIASADVERIFSRFERAAPVSHYGGLGLGLYLTRSIVKAHGGSIRVQSNPEQGSTFAVELPRDRRPARAELTPEGDH